MRYRRAPGHCQIRFVVDLKWEEFQDIIQKHLNENGFDMVTVQDAPEANAGGFKASRTNPDHPWPSYVARVRHKDDR